MPVAHRSTCEYSAALSSEFWQVPTVERVRSILGQSERGRTERCNAAALTHKLAPRALRVNVFPDTSVLAALAWLSLRREPSTDVRRRATHPSDSFVLAGDDVFSLFSLSTA